MQMYRYKECTIFLSLKALWLPNLLQVSCFCCCLYSLYMFCCWFSQRVLFSWQHSRLEYDFTVVTVQASHIPAFFLHMQHNGWSCEKYKPGIYCRGSSRGVRRRLKVGEGEVVHIKHVLGIQFMIISVRIQTSTCSSRNKWAFSTDSGII